VVKRIGAAGVRIVLGVPSILGSLMADPNKVPKVMETFMKMKKFDIEALKSAAR